MSDQPDAATFRASMCPEDGCHALIPAEYRQNHIDKHKSDLKAKRATTARFTDLDLAFADVKDEVRGMRRELAQIEIPPQKDPIVIEEWPDDELGDTSDFEDSDDPFTNDEVHTVPSPVPAAEHVNASADDDDDDDEETDQSSSLYTPGTF